MERACLAKINELAGYRRAKENDAEKTGQSNSPNGTCTFVARMLENWLEFCRPVSIMRTGAVCLNGPKEWRKSSKGHFLKGLRPSPEG